MGLLTDAHRPGASSVQKTRPAVKLIDFPPELILHILSNVHWSDYYTICGTSKGLRALATIPGSLSASRYGYLFPVPPNTVLPRQTDRPFEVHRLFSCASSRDGKPYYRISIPAAAAGFTQARSTKTISLATSPFRNDPFSHPECHKTVVSWVYVDSVKAIDEDDLIDTIEQHARLLVPHRGALYVNNLIVGTGTGRADDGSQGHDSTVPMDQTDEAGDGDGAHQLPYITVMDVFDAFDRDHPYLRERRGGRVTIVGFQHVFHPSAGTWGGSHFEVRWMWIADQR
ncbi:hypothetical protein TWF696_003312 [Orbilia brochopaga]|uniref:F-box domain-containing protein n=1 Tax=Orbilia brochopaga TaxID=3140254 RepID=A0AAV9TYT5_9PEZI